ncbi:5-oxoprolinase subunit PxpB [Streptomyces sp. LX-29]|uniref:5-oxoprolinase subunit PxpB n=1 Tax=Streptomyces sp. LX-29 TaxID=2900152 RepID=UPI00240D3E54|nr:5-oxoprolinase subunit PxpB [Streptomyces sp. LX-29]WFB11454.1 5-oxoprolinase subunit PxpB [Streptomyces sp. LX-29]
MRGLPVGEHALLLEVEPAEGADGPEAAEALHAEVLRRAEARELPPVRVVVPAARTVLLDGVAEPARLAAEVAEWRVPPLARDHGPTLEIPVRYDGPDLADVAAVWGVAPEEVARIHAATEFRVAFCGFAPGFGYLTGLPRELHVPRRATPRTRVPAGSVALAGPYTGVYPRSSPGGWQLIGTTDAVLWDTARTPAALLSPGTRVRFVPRGDADVPRNAEGREDAEAPEDTEGREATGDPEEAADAARGLGTEPRRTRKGARAK